MGLITVRRVDAGEFSLAEFPLARFLGASETMRGEQEHETLERWAHRLSTAQALALRSRIVLGAAAGQMNIEIAAALGCHPVTAGKWRQRFAQHRLDGLSDEPRPGAPRTIASR